MNLQVFLPLTPNTFENIKKKRITPNTFTGLQVLMC